MIELQPFTASDIPRLLGWVDSSDFLLQWGGPSFVHPLDEAQLLAHLGQAAGPEPSLLIFKVVSSESGEKVGHVELAGIDRRHRSGSVARVLVGPDAARGRGLGTAIMRAILAIGFEQLALHRIDLRVFDFNLGAIAAYERVGFKKEGLHRERCKATDGYWSAWTMAILEDEWRSQRAAPDEAI
jgi:RimJ/RimL family protein N-acetyltransferase